MLGPNAVPAGGKNPVGIDSVLERLVESQERMIVERIGVHHRSLVSRRRAVLAPAVLGRDSNQPLERRPVLFVRLRIVRDRKAIQKDERCSQ